MGPDQAVRALRITARDRYSDRCWGRGEPLPGIFDSVRRLTLTGLPAAMQLGNWAHMGNIAGMDRTSTKW
jgi:hypothetical protein